MDNDRARAVGQALKEARSAQLLSTRQLAEAAGVDQATIVRLESGSFQAPRAETLVRVAEALRLNSVDILTLAGITTKTALPTMRPYLRAKYKELRVEDIDAIERYATRLAKKRGVSLHGPTPGEDEQ